MFTRGKLFSITMPVVLAFSTTALQAQSLTSPRKSSDRNVAPMAGGAQAPVVGGGTIGRLPKWTGFTGSNSIIGDTSIFEDKFGKVGVGTDTPTSKLTVQGMIETTMGGLKFPDGTLQTTAAVSGLQSIFHDGTLTGDGTSALPLGIAIPLTLNGVSDQAPILTILNTGQGDGIVATAGSTITDDAPAGVRAVGGDSLFGRAGRGMTAQGGNHTGSDFAQDAGAGISARGGDSANGFGGVGVFATGGAGSANSHGGDGIVASGGAPDGFAGFFEGLVEITGSLRVGQNLSVQGTKNFKIDHPLDPENRYLLHAAIESSEVLNIYSGNITTDENGNAVITLPDWFEAINRDFRYQLTVVGTFAQAIVVEKIKSNRFSIKTNSPNVEVSWQVTGVRSDAVMLIHPFKAEQGKPDGERGYYLSPDAYGQPTERGVDWARHPQMMQRLKEKRERTRERAQPH
jgi:hypothetical protein